MFEWLQLILPALLMILLLMSPFCVPVICFVAQIFVCEHRPRLLLVLPIVTAVALFAWSPSYWNELVDVIYCLDMFGAFVGSTLGAIVCTAANWKRWFRQ